MLDGAETRKARGNGLFAQGKYKEAMAIYAEIVTDLVPLSTTAQSKTLIKVTRQHPLSCHLPLLSACLPTWHLSESARHVCAGVCFFFLEFEFRDSVATQWLDSYFFYTGFAFVEGGILTNGRLPPGVSQACRLNIARCKLETKEYDDVIAQCSTVLKDHPKDFKAL